MSPSTGRSGGSQPGRRGRRRGRRGGGTSAGHDGSTAGANPADPNSGKTTGKARGRASANPSRNSSGNSGGNSGGKAGAKTGGKTSGKTGRKFVKPGGRRLRTVDETSAGGLVVDAGRASAALIGRLDRRGRLLWSLPKGHIESGETPEQAAIREVAEETGIAGRVLAPLGTIDYWFVAEDRRVHKTVHHFLMEAVGGELSDEDVEVTEVAWVPLGELDGRLAYADERRLVRLATELLSESA